MIGKELRANASYPLQNSSKTAYLFIAAIVLLMYVVGSVISSSLSL